MNNPTMISVFLALAFGIYMPAGQAGACPCNGDVNDDGVVNIVDGACIRACVDGDCSCCVNFCDINCDGVVDGADAAEDIINEDSTWLCLFYGGSPETCCPGSTGACCDLATGVCADGVFAPDCTGGNSVWSEGLACVDVSCPSPPTGACCDLATGICQDGVFAQDCTGGDLVWSEGLSCVDVSCPAPPTGACCNLGNGQCQDAVLQADCGAADMVWTPGTSCVQVECAVPPQDPCPCDGDVNDDGVVNIVDGACIRACVDGDCSCCVNFCDINCDGVVDGADAAEDLINEDSTWLCLFQGGAQDFCCSPDFQDQLMPNGIPAVSEWGMVALTLLMLTVATLVFKRRRPDPA